MEGTSVRFRTSDPRPVVGELMTLLGALEVDVAELSVRKATLEDVLLNLIDGGLSA